MHERMLASLPGVQKAQICMARGVAHAGVTTAQNGGSASGYQEPAPSAMSIGGRHER
jgi:hypothetical protein